MVTRAIDAGQVKLERQARGHRKEAYDGRKPNRIPWVCSHG
jgi:hypothetical protein